jgi:Zn-dependent peptidase ImmA (M78 family)
MLNNLDAQYQEQLAKIKDPEVFIPKTIHHCANSGVAQALVPEMKKVPWHGATKWLSASKAMILLNLRGKMEDQFWFSFFHEAGHVLHDSKKDLYINDGSTNDPREYKANEFAAEILIPRDRGPEIASSCTKADVIRIADELKISSGIIAGRFQYLTGKCNYFNGLKRKFWWTA